MKLTALIAIEMNISMRLVPLVYPSLCIQTRLPIATLKGRYSASSLIKIIIDHLKSNMENLCYQAFQN